MPLSSALALVEVIRQFQLLEPEQLEVLTDDLQVRFADPRGLARELIQRDWLTPYQVNQVFAGRGAELGLGSYLVLERLGEGGMGAVFKARHRTLGRVVAYVINGNLAGAIANIRLNGERGTGPMQIYLRGLATPILFRKIEVREISALPPEVLESAARMPGGP